ncbi:uncharacterized protein MELLADRAFT_68278 [Melampsora larici-populina 98AG31]|uniref:Secreted protein n=1 Tax=Melampsora larici-populina (strain 98AG31 / pathotype 3-4-7) TaxID=747676 RepID=F4S675_MELLP|nr:uncharacterized protein MELLADRAFT_68278 [Melampsora larici-populina 98AG31]EGF99892.1 hypothetical protein MELLADRAFT_68278 [Melampsora larici-populina 98AG31]
MMFLMYWAIVIVTLNQRRCGSVQLFKPELAPTSAHFVSETSPDSIRTEEEVSSSFRSARGSNSVNSSPQAEEKDEIAHTRYSGPVEADNTPAHPPNVSQHAHESKMARTTADPSKDNPGREIRSGASRRSKVQSAEHLKLNGQQDSRPIFNLDRDYHESPPVPIYSAPSPHHHFSAYGGFDGMGHWYAEPYSYSGFPIQQYPYHQMQYGSHVPPRLVDPLSGITYVPYYPAVPMASPFYVHPPSHVQPSIVYPAIPTYHTPAPFFSPNYVNLMHFCSLKPTFRNLKPHGIRNPSTNWQADLGNPHPVDTLELPLNSGNKVSAMDTRKPSRSSRAQAHPSYSRPPDSAREQRSQRIPLDEKLKHTIVDSEIEFPPLLGKSIADQPPVRKPQLKQEAARDKGSSPTVADKSSPDIDKTSVSGSKDLSGGTRNNDGKRELNLNEVLDVFSSRSEYRSFRRPTYPGSVKSHQHVNKLIASSKDFGDIPNRLDDSQEYAKNTGFGQIEKVLIGDNWGHTGETIMSNPSGKDSDSGDNNELQSSQESFDMDLWIRRLKYAKGFLTFHTRKDLYDLESPGKYSVSNNVDLEKTEQQPPESSTKAATNSPVFPPIISQKVDEKKTRTNFNIPQGSEMKDQCVNNEILKPPITDVTKNTVTSSTLKEPKQSLKENYEVQSKRFQKIIDTKTRKLPHVAAPPQTIVQKDAFQKRPLLQKVSLDATKNRGVEKHSGFKKTDNRPNDLLDHSQKESTKEEPKKTNSNTKSKYIQAENEKMNLLSEIPVPDKKTPEILESDDINGIKEKFIVPSSIKSVKIKQENSGGCKRNTKNKLASKPTSRNTKDEDTETKPSESLAKSSYGLLERLTPRFQDLKSSNYLGVISPIQKGVPALWSQIKTTPEIFMQRMKEIKFSKWGLTDRLSSESTNINLPHGNPQKTSSTVGLQSNPGLLAKFTTKIPDRKLSDYLGHMVPYKHEFISFWCWATQTPYPIQRRASDFWSETGVQAHSEEFHHQEKLDGELLKTDKQEANVNEVDGVKIEHQKDPSESSGIIDTDDIVRDQGHEKEVDVVEIKHPKDLSESSGNIDTKDIVWDQGQKESSNVKTNNGKETVQSILVQKKDPSHSDHISKEITNKQVDMSDEETVQFICSLLKVKNKKKFLPIKVTQEDFELAKRKSLLLDKRMFALIRDKSPLSLVEFTRRSVALEAQMNQFEISKILNERGDLINNRAKDLLLIAFRIDIPWETFTNLTIDELKYMNNLIEYLSGEPSDLEVLKKVLGPEFRIRRAIISYMLKRKGLPKWWDEEKLVEGRKQGVDLVKVLTIGDVLEFGNMDITKTSLQNKKKVTEKMEALHKSFILDKSPFPWHDSPERAWLQSQPELWKLYQDRLRLVILACETLQDNYHFILTADDGETNEDSWWQFGDYLMWIDEGINKLPMPAIGDSLNLGKDRAKNAKILKRVDWKTKLQTHDPVTRKKIESYFEKRRVLNTSKFKIETPVSTLEKIGNIFRSSISWS